MNEVRFRIKVLAMLLCCFAPFATAQRKDLAAKEAILGIEQQWLHAKSPQAAARFMAEDFVGISTRGVIESRQQRLARFRPAPQPPATDVHFEHLGVEFPAPKVAIATGDVVGTTSAGKTVYVVAFSDTFCRRRGRWLAIHAQETLKPTSAQ